MNFPPSPPLIRIISQSRNNIGDDGMRAIADAILTNSSVFALAARMKSGEMRRLKRLNLVRLFSVLFQLC